MRIIQISASVENEAAGTTYCIKRLARSLAAAGHTVDLLSTGTALDVREGNLRMRTYPVEAPFLPFVGRLSFSHALRAEIEQAAAAGAVLHGNGLWLLPNLYPSWAARRHGAPLLIAPHGMLSPSALQFSAGRKRVFDAIVQRHALEAAHCFHATSQEEFEEIRAYGLDAPVAIIPNGIDLPSLDDSPVALDRTGRTMLYLGRMHPIKGLDRLLEAWARVETANPEWRLRLVGPSHGHHRAELEALAASLRLARVKFEDGIYGDGKSAVLRQSDVLVLPSLNENFAMVVAEALAYATPVISTKGAPWEGLTKNGCGWWIDHGVEPMVAALAEAISMPRARLDAMGEKGRAWMARDYSWDRIAADMESVYRWCLSRGEMPNCVVNQR